MAKLPDIQVKLDITGDVINARPEVVNFAKVMEQVLRENGHKTGWRPSDNYFNNSTFFIKKLREEFDELTQELHLLERGCGNVQRIRREAADLANICMMVTDNYGGGLRDEKPPVPLTSRIEVSMHNGAPLYEVRTEEWADGSWCPGGVMRFTTRDLNAAVERAESLRTHGVQGK